MSEIFVLCIRPDWGDETSAVFPAVLRDGTYLALIDCGYVGSLPLLEAAFTKQGLSCACLTHVVITHHDHDHIGALAALKRRYPRINVVASEGEAAFIEGRTPALRLTQARAIQPVLEGEAAASGLAFIHLLETVEPSRVDVRVKGGNVLPFCGCEVLETPGHTAGHISLFVRELDVLITGDAAIAEGGALALANPAYAEDLARAKDSLHMLKSVQASTVVCYHGGVLSD